MWINIFLSGHDDSYFVHYTLWIFFFFACPVKVGACLISLCAPPNIYSRSLSFSLCCAVDRCVWNHMVRPVAPVGLRKSSCASHHIRGGKDLHWDHNWRKCAPDECNWGVNAKLPHQLQQWFNCCQVKIVTLPLNLKSTEIQDSMASLLYLHARLRHHRGQFLPQLDLLPAPDQPTGLLWGGLWLSHQQGQRLLLTTVSRCPNTCIRSFSLPRSWIETMVDVKFANRWGYCLLCPTWLWPSWFLLEGSWLTSCAATRSCPPQMWGSSWTAAVSFGKNHCLVLLLMYARCHIYAVSLRFLA